MKYDNYGQAYTDVEELCDLLYQQPQLDLSLFNVTKSHEYNNSVKKLFADFPLLKQFEPTVSKTVEEFDAEQQTNWHMPESYKQLDIAQWILEKCTTDQELQRVGEELLLFQERNLFPLLQYMRYLVDTMRKHDIVWGVGRGSSVASFVLYKIGVHRIDSLYYDLDPREFLK